MLSVLPVIDPDIAKLAPGFRALSISAKAAGIANPGISADAMERAFQSLAAGDAPWADAHLSAWADVFRKFGAKPQRTPCSAEALRKRVLRDGSLPGINPIVDLYNAISIQYAVPVGGENLSAYSGAPRLTIADGMERFDTMQNGVLSHESPKPGEVVWRDDQGVTCRRWNWRQGVRTRLNPDATQMWFILEALPAMPPEALQEAGERLTKGLRLLMAEAVIEQNLIALDQVQ